ncbi:TetR family transcriptional regulator [Streptomyces rimosus subsp. rimosus]|uniref:TetR family transcriptional regulator n=2 Tax=Streptomyces rimosus subsp. rimosus TaxID=132474 RepID=A0A8A1UXD8_STRR1|nr:MULTISPECIES: TetR family transcriptional regulator [Streptomyces]KOG83876.1 TetR family transcriptional regulator [Kitasatospora aureofaciens]MYT42617.1 TetR family transcriptional regulator [Streptomyces sp. SID5471]KEF07213.1 TetR family transcriptional regulator [Streptomyces rimosus]KOT45856.1 TetR family transcriptional regulator [Streptomyces rimosus subsp. rimosus]KOT47186.1 TetR family transcriptional regulator [Streptomyces sp. NRRL WC-3701]
MASAQRSAARPTAPKAGLRERKKIQTRQAIRRAAYRLFEEQGYDATPVDRIAEAADVSPSTVFRYFPTKEDIVLTDEYDPMLEAELRARPADEPMIESLRHVTVEALRRITVEERTELVQRARLMREVPAIRGRMAENTARDTDMISAVLAERSGRPADDLEIRVIAAALLAALQEALMRWVADGQRDDLEGLIDRAMDVLARGLRF